MTREVAEFALAPLEGMPPEVERAGARTIVNAVALMVGAARHPAVERALEAALTFEMAPESSVLGRAERLSLFWTALLGGIAAHVEDFDDTHLRTVLHPGAPIVPAALAVGEWLGAGGREVLEAVVVGVEIAARVGNAVCPEHFDRGWHVTGTLGHLGAAAAAGRLLRLPVDQMVNALGVSATQGAGIGAAFGTMTKAFHAGKAAADGVEAALLAGRGFTAAPASIEGRRGFARTMSSRFDAREVLEGLGQRWEVLDNAFKPYACGIVAHPAIDAAVALGKRLGGSRVAEIVAEVNPVVLDVMGIARPAGGLQGKFSVHHAVAVAIADGQAGPAQFTDARVADEAVADLRARVRIVMDKTIAKDAARMHVTTDHGDRLAVHVEHATGSVSRPMTDDQLREKARAQIEPVLGDRADALIEMSFGIAKTEDVRALVAAARPLARR